MLGHPRRLIGRYHEIIEFTSVLSPGCLASWLPRVFPTVTFQMLDVRLEEWSAIEIPAIRRRQYGKSVFGALP